MYGAIWVLEMGGGPLYKVHDYLFFSSKYHLISIGNGIKQPENSLNFRERKIAKYFVRGKQVFM